ncbi:MAG: IS200/IS605 family transposase [Ignavibacteria bacterium]|nr:IS200/IS605 family transposase [Ignavibacteria bacterium]
MSYMKVWIHAVWGTKHRYPYLTKEIRGRVLDHIRENARQKEIYIDRLSGHNDHLHCVFGLNADMSIAKALQLMKGEATRWINQERITPVRFEWASEYYAVSVSDSALNRVRSYIANQEEHHRMRSYAEEVEGLMQEYDFIHHG